MAKLTRILHKIFGASATSDQMSVYGSYKNGSTTPSLDPAVISGQANWLQGMTGGVIGRNSPLIEEMNGLFFHTGRQLGYLFQQGIPEYDPNETYYIGSYCTLAGRLYKCTVDNTTGLTPLVNKLGWTPNIGEEVCGIYNGRVVPTVGSNALSLNLKTMAGSAPSGADPVIIILKTSVGNLQVCKVTTAITTLVINSASTLGHSNNVPCPIHIGIINTYGNEAEIVVSTSNQIVSGVPIEIAAEGGGYARDGYQFFGATARASQVGMPLGIILSTQATTGVWASLPIYRQDKAGHPNYYPLVSGVTPNATTLIQESYGVSEGVSFWDSGKMRFKTFMQGVWTHHQDRLSVKPTSATVTTTLADVPASTLTLTAGNWKVFMDTDMGINLETSPGGAAQVSLGIAKADNTLLKIKNHYISTYSTGHYMSSTVPVCSSTTISVPAGSTQVLKLRTVKVDYTGTSVCTVCQFSDSEFYAERIL